MYNLRSRGGLALAGSARPHRGMGVRAPPPAASQLTPSQALDVLDIANVPETELFGDDDMSGRSNSIVSDDSLDDETIQSFDVSQPIELQQNSTVETVGSERIKRTQKCSIPDPTLKAREPILEKRDPILTCIYGSTDSFAK